MDYSKLYLGDIFSCKVRATYAEIFVYTENKFVKVFSLQKKDYPDILGLGEKVIDVNGLVPITLTNETIQFILKKTYGVGAVSTSVLVQQNANLVRPGFQPTVRPNITDPDLDDKTVDIDPIQLLAIDPVVYVYQSSIDCELVPQEDVVIEDEEDIEEEIIEDKKDYSKLIWIALAAAAALL